MILMKKWIVCSIGAVALVAVLIAQDSEPKASKKGGVLHPEMTVAADAGTYDAPAGKMGQSSAEPWSATTIGAGVDKKPEPGKPITVAGEIMDFSCYLQVGKHGEKHKSCGVKCLQNGQPIGLLTKNGAIYLLMEEEHDPRRDSQTTFRQAAIDNFAKIIEVTGTETQHAGVRAIYVEGYVKK
jgi:hypothetical protein